MTEHARQLPGGPGSPPRLRARETAVRSRPVSPRPAPPKLYRMGEIVHHTGVSRQTIHNYTTMGLITEARRTEGGHRLYEEGVFARLDLVAEMKRQNKSMREIRHHFAELDEGR